MSFIQYEPKRQYLSIYHHENDKAIYSKEKYAAKAAEA